MSVIAQACRCGACLLTGTDNRAGQRDPSCRQRTWP